MTYEELEKNYLQIPQEMKDTKRWVCYKTEERDGEVTKIPMNAISGGYAKTDDNSTWTSFKIALRGCVKYGFVGLGFMLGEGYFGVDLDNHVDKKTGQKPFATNDEFEEFAREFIDQLNSYTEYSHSLEGIHIICKGSLPEGARKRKGVEMYDWRRFFTMTGKVINNVPVAERSKEVLPLWEKYLNAPQEEQKAAFKPKNIEVEGVRTETGGIKFVEVERTTVEYAPSQLADSELVDRIRNSQQGVTFMALYNGDMSAYSNDHSAADMAFCKILAFWTGNDAEQMDRIFRSSALMRPKWDRSWGNSTYGAHVIQKAIATQYEVYAPPKEKTEIVINYETKAPIQPQGEIVVFDDKNDPIVKVKKIFKHYTLTDTGNAERFYDYFSGYFRYNATNNIFLFWNGKTWITDVKNYVKKFADKIIDVLKEEILDNEKEIAELGKMEEPDLKKIDDLTDLVKAQRRNLDRVSNKAGKEAMINEFKHLHEISVENSEFDKQPNLLNTDSGVVNLDTGEVMPFNKSYMLSKNTNCLVSFETPTTWIKFLHDIFRREGHPEETEEIIECVQMGLGETLTGRNNKDHLFILYGNGSNGKSTFIRTVDECFGDYAKTINSELLLQSKVTNAQSTEFSMAALIGARMLSMSETNENEKMNDKIIKQMTSGEKIAAQFKFGNSFSYKPTFSPWMSTNNLPIIRSKDFGIWRRIYLIPFLAKFDDSTKDIHMPEKLQKELPQILGWMIKGNLKLNNDYKGILPKPKCLEAALADYKKEMDVINLYVAAHCQNFANYKTNAMILFQDYKKWALDNNEYLMSESKFRGDMAAHGYPSKRDVNEGWVYIGIKLNSDQRGHIFEDLEEEDKSDE